jgi:hypothetical protein
LPSIVTFREVEKKRWQAIAVEDRPHPFPDENDVVRPDYVSDEPDVTYAAGWHVGLRIGETYTPEFSLALTDDWPETEFVFFQRADLEPENPVSYFIRMASFGAVTTTSAPGEIAPTAEDWLVTCWSKRRIRWDEPWIGAEPRSFALDQDSPVLTLRFSRADDGGDSVLPTVRLGARAPAKQGRRAAS